MESLRIHGEFGSPNYQLNCSLFYMSDYDLADVWFHSSDRFQNSKFLNKFPVEINPYAMNTAMNRSDHSNFKFSGSLKS